MRIPNSCSRYKGI